MDDKAFLNLVNSQTTHMMALRGIVTCLVAGIEPTDERVMQVLAPFFPPGEDASRMRNAVAGTIGDMLTAGALLRASK